MTRDAMAFLREDALLPGIHQLIPERVSLTQGQVAQYGLPTVPPKVTDLRSRSWTRGETCQAEALPPDMLATIIRNAIETNLDRRVFDTHEQAEAAERVALLRALPSGG